MGRKYLMPVCHAVTVATEESTMINVASDTVPEDKQLSKPNFRNEVEDDSSIWGDEE